MLLFRRLIAEDPGGAVVVVVLAVVVTGGRVLVVASIVVGAAVLVACTGSGKPCSANIFVNSIADPFGVLGLSGSLKST